MSVNINTEFYLNIELLQGKYTSVEIQPKHYIVRI